jgi:formate hydrogenlyase subunit 3/multisubunit Na+/H+ antiporter MnhD subunit
MTTNVFSRPWSLLLRVVLGIDALLIALSFTTWFSGDAKHAGVADRLFRPISGNGFRLDFLYVLFVGLFAVVMLVLFVFPEAQIRPTKRDVWLYALVLFGTAAYVIYAVVSGVLDFG